MNYELAKKLKDAGFPQGEGAKYLTCHSYDSSDSCREDEHIAYAPTLSELIEACGENFSKLERKAFADSASNPYRWYVLSLIDLLETEGTTPEEAVANLYIALHPHV
jgi:hypothetical protein